ncbi:hypothetical protein MP228_002553 [Amoeboaphelidium protococcarum]|nr:hypothetical protein MP228_002553 [Amoeboaphelidium protococcarum]
MTKAQCKVKSVVWISATKDYPAWLARVVDCKDDSIQVELFALNTTLDIALGNIYNCNSVSSLKDVQQLCDGPYVLASASTSSSSQLGVFDYLKSEGLQSRKRNKFLEALNAYYNYLDTNDSNIDGQDSASDIEDDLADSLPTMDKAIKSPADKKKPEVIELSDGDDDNSVIIQHNLTNSTRKKFTSNADKDYNDSSNSKRKLADVESSSQVSSAFSSKASKSKYSDIELSKGDLVLARWRRSYTWHPARVIEVIKDSAYVSNWRIRYKLEYWDKYVCIVDRSCIRCPHDFEFHSVQISSSITDHFNCSNDKYEDEELKEKVMKLSSYLQDICSGDINTQRRQDFLAGGQRKAQLDKKCGKGTFTAAEYGLIQRTVELLFNTEIMPRLSRADNSQKQQQLKGLYGLSFMTSVLMPECIMKLMIDDSDNSEVIDSVSAEKALTDLDWVEYLLALRESVSVIE